MRFLIGFFAGLALGFGLVALLMQAEEDSERAA
jgi:hypothetical protein